MSKLVKIILFFFVYLVVAAALVIIFDQLGLSRSDEARKLTNNVKNTTKNVTRRAARGVKNAANVVADTADAVTEDLFEPEKIEIPKEDNSKQMAAVSDFEDDINMEIGEEIDINDVPEFEVLEEEKEPEMVVETVTEEIDLIKPEPKAVIKEEPKKAKCHSDKYAPAFNNDGEKKTYYHALYFLKNDKRNDAIEKFIELISTNNSTDFMVDLAWNYLLNNQVQEAGLVLNAIDKTKPMNEQVSCHLLANIAHAKLIVGNRNNPNGALAIYKELYSLYEGAEKVLESDFADLKEAYPRLTVPSVNEIRK